MVFMRVGKGHVQKGVFLSNSLPGMLSPNRLGRTSFWRYPPSPCRQLKIWMTPERRIYKIGKAACCAVSPKILSSSSTRIGLAR